MDAGMKLRSGPYVCGLTRVSVLEYRWRYMYTTDVRQIIKLAYGIMATVVDILEICLKTDLDLVSFLLYNVHEFAFVVFKREFEHKKNN